MAYTFDAVAWEAWPPSRGGDGMRRDVKHDPDGTAILPPAQRVHGVKVLVTNDAGETDIFWTWTMQKFQNWSEWYVFVDARIIQGARAGGSLEIELGNLED